MKKLEKPPDWKSALPDAVRKLEDAETYFRAVQEINRQYLSWDKISQDWFLKKWGIEDPSRLWAYVQMTRSGAYRYLKLVDKFGQPFRFSMPDSILEGVCDVSRYSTTKIKAADGEPLPGAESFLMDSIMEEAIASSQLEGAATTRKAAKEMIRNGRAPRTYDEKMILNNYMTILKIKEMLGTTEGQQLSIPMLHKLHRSMTEGTLKEAADTGRFRQTDEIVVVDTTTGEMLHQPPPYADLEQRIQRVCDFANGKFNDGFLPHVIRAAVLHFLIGYEHPYVDGNGRTARALFYWFMLKSGYPAVEYLSISKVIKKAPAQYARAYMRTEVEDGDLTYFISFHLRLLRRALDKFADHVRRKQNQQKVALAQLRRLRALNHRQVALLDHALRHPGTRYTFSGHALSHNISYMTARNDLYDLVKRKYLEMIEGTRPIYFYPVGNLEAKLRGRRQVRK